MKWLIPLLSLALCAAPCLGQSNYYRPTAADPELLNKAPVLPPSFHQVATPYYVLYTDVTVEEAREADLRLTRIFEEYQRRTAAFAVAPKDKLPFYLFRHEADYRAAGGPPRSDGVYIESLAGKRLMAIAGDHTSAETWHTIQHEGFHQFIAASIKYPIPIWVNEGLAEYFGEGQWTGDGFITGLIPNERLANIRKGIRSTFQPFRQFMNMSDAQWNDNLQLSNYDQAWSMVHFLGHAEHGRYQAAFVQYLTAVSKGIKNQDAWNAAFGANNDEQFQLAYAHYWLSLPDNPTQNGYLEALVQTDTSFLARAVLLRQRISDPMTFLTRYQPPDFLTTRDLWLPPSLFTQNAELAPDLGRWSFRGQNLVLELSDGTTFVGSFVLANDKVAKVQVDVVKK